MLLKHWPSRDWNGFSGCVPMFPATISKPKVSRMHAENQIWEESAEFWHHFSGSRDPWIYRSCSCKNLHTFWLFFTRSFLCWLELCGAPGSWWILIWLSRSPTERMLTPSNRINPVTGVSACWSRPGFCPSDHPKLDLSYSPSTGGASNELRDAPKVCKNHQQFILSQIYQYN